MNAMTKPPGVQIMTDYADAPILFSSADMPLGIKAGTSIFIDPETKIDLSFATDTAIALPGDMRPGMDYALCLKEDGTLDVLLADAVNPLERGAFAGFHYALGSNASARAGGDSISQINPHSFWDVGFRPTCQDPRGMVLVTLPGNRCVWVDIYLLNASHADLGTSRSFETIADGASLDVLDYAAAAKIVAEHGKRLMTYEEFYVAAYGVKERSSASRDPKKTGLDAERTSRFGLMQATGNMWVWGTDGDPDEQRPSFFGGSWLSGSFAGSRGANLDYWPEYSSGLIGVRAASDHLQPE